MIYTLFQKKGSVLVIFCDLAVFTSVYNSFPSEFLTELLRGKEPWHQSAHDPLDPKRKNIRKLFLNNFLKNYLRKIPQDNFSEEILRKKSLREKSGNY